ncbi:hypothetical protein [Chitinophaga sp. 212800010-3]|jgi:hypothetical protein|uniref:hypothetical protein n=1 Tax=unclassified Chitinophaga TaxID=2619133 RepID=UPI002DEC280E|nr:AbrB family transcriptional regulator [Chitinophaga sp. 212800010-3]
MSTFNILLNDYEIGITRQDENVFIVRLPEKIIRLQRREDNEGADYWFEEGADNTTKLTEAIGEVIERWLAATSR